MLDQMKEGAERLAGRGQRTQVSTLSFEIGTLMGFRKLRGTGYTRFLISGHGIYDRFSVLERDHRLCRQYMGQKLLTRYVRLKRVYPPPRVVEHPPGDVHRQRLLRYLLP